LSLDSARVAIYQMIHLALHSSHNFIEYCQIREPLGARSYLGHAFGTHRFGSRACPAL
jgi:hypothetical protein